MKNTCPFATPCRRPEPGLNSSPFEWPLGCCWGRGNRIFSCAAAALPQQSHQRKKRMQSFDDKLQAPQRSVKVSENLENGLCPPKLPRILRQNQKVASETHGAPNLLGFSKTIEKLCSRKMGANIMLDSYDGPWE